MKEKDDSYYKAKKSPKRDQSQKYSSEDNHADDFMLVNDNKELKGSEIENSQKILSSQSMCNQFMTVLQLVIQTQQKKNYHYMIGVATILMVSTFATVLMAVSPLMDILNLQIAQKTMSDIDILITASPVKGTTYVDLNQSPYMNDPFAITDTQINPFEAQGDTESSLTENLSGLKLMNTPNIRQQIMDHVGDEIEAVTGRWTFFSKLVNPESIELETSAKTFAVDQAYELKSGIGRLFDSKKLLGRRETFISKENARQLQLDIGQDVVMRYDIALLLNTIQIMSGEILPSIFVKGAT